MRIGDSVPCLLETVVRVQQRPGSVEFPVFVFEALASGQSSRGYGVLYSWGKFVSLLDASSRFWAILSQCPRQGQSNICTSYTGHSHRDTDHLKLWQRSG